MDLHALGQQQQDGEPGHAVGGGAEAGVPVTGGGLDLLDRGLRVGGVGELVDLAAEPLVAPPARGGRVRHQLLVDGLAVGQGQAGGPLDQLQGPPLAAPAGLHGTPQRVAPAPPRTRSSRTPRHPTPPPRHGRGPPHPAPRPTPRAPAPDSADQGCWEPGSCVDSSSNMCSKQGSWDISVAGSRSAEQLTSGSDCLVGLVGEPRSSCVEPPATRRRAARGAARAPAPPPGAGARGW